MSYPFILTEPRGRVALVSQVVDLCAPRGVPVLAAGGVTTGRHLAAALALGASGVWTGTLWLASRESDVNPPLKEKLIESPWHRKWMSEAVGQGVDDVTSMKPARQILSDLIDEALEVLERFGRL